MLFVLHGFSIKFTSKHRLDFERVQGKIGLLRTFFLHIILCTFGTASLFGQGIERRTYYDQEKTALKEIYYLEDTIQNILSGPFKSFYLSGRVKSEGAYANNRATGSWTNYYENGNVKNAGTFLDGKTIDIWTYYYENGNIRSEGILSDNVKAGKWSFYYEDGGLKSDGEFVEGIREGIWNYYYEGGVLKAQATFKNGNGLYREFYVSGSIKMQGLNRQGKSDSLWTYYFETGEKLAEGYYQKGLKTGPWKYFYKNGGISAEGGYVDGETIGNWIYYYEDGSKSAEGLQKNGLKDGYWKMFYETGETKGVGELEAGTGKYTEYYVSGKLKVQGQFLNDHNHGEWMYYDEEGNIEGKANFDKGVGEYEGYYLNGDIKMKGQIADGKRIGEWTLYKRNGEIAGKYHPVYQEDNPIYFAEGDLAEERSRLEYDKPEYRFKNKRSRYFTPVVNEYKGIIIQGNPLFSLAGFVPISIEYYRQERLGYELQYVHQRNPFFTSHADRSFGEPFTNGFSLNFKQKFYSPDQKYGMFYFGHLLGLKRLVHEANVMGEPDYLARLDQVSYYYGAVLGNRWTRHPGNAGVTVDVYFGFGLGYLDESKNYSGNLLDPIFSDVIGSGFYVPVFFGVDIGYLGFKKYKNLPVPSRK